MVASVGAAVAVPPPVWHKPPTFEQLDSNKDGSLSLAELERAGPSFTGGDSAFASAGAQAMFKQLDANGDGSVSKSEFSVFQSDLGAQSQSLALQFQEIDGATPAPAQWVAGRYGAASALGQSASHAGDRLAT